VGALTVPAAGLVYLDANSVIYSVEKHQVYWPLLQPIWVAISTTLVEVVSSDLVLMESLVGPFKSGDAALAAAYENLFKQPKTRLLPITHAVLREAAHLRATTRLKTPDAIHAATARQAGCTLFVTNDAAFRGLAGLPVAILDDYLTP
jgi:predicted nucleic acid-binding protein